MKKFFIAILLLFSLSVSLFSCAEKNVSLLECGNDIVSLISLMTKSNEYKTLYDLPEAYEAALSELSTADYSLPSAVYELRVPESAFIEPSINLSSVS